jgi:hypothetical protein
MYLLACEKKIWTEGHNNKNLGNTPAEIQRNQKLVDNNNQDYAKVDKSKGGDFLFITATAAATHQYT